MARTKIRLVAIDLDGTLLNSRKELHPQTVQAVEAVKQSGIMVTLATGRTFGSTAPFAKLLGIDIPIITNNGAYIAAVANNQVVEKKTMLMEQAKTMISQLEQAGYYIKVYIDDHLYVQQATEETHDFSRRFGVPFTAVGKLNLAKMKANPLKVAVIDRSERIKEVWRMLEPWKDHFCISRDGEQGIEITEKTANKGAALATLCRLLHISMNDVMAIGNEGNDVSMVRNAGIGVAMGNAYEELKQLAAIVTKTNDELGVAYVLKNYILHVEPPG